MQPDEKRNCSAFFVVVVREFFTLLLSSPLSQDIVVLYWQSKPQISKNWARLCFPLTKLILSFTAFVGHSVHYDFVYLLVYVSHRVAKLLPFALRIAMSGFYCCKNSLLTLVKLLFPPIKVSRGNQLFIFLSNWISTEFLINIIFWLTNPNQIFQWPYFAQTWFALI